MNIFYRLLGILFFPLSSIPANTADSSLAPVPSFSTLWQFQFNPLLSSSNYCPESFYLPTKPFLTPRLCILPGPLDRCAPTLSARDRSLCGLHGEAVGSQASLCQVSARDCTLVIRTTTIPSARNSAFQLWYVPLQHYNYANL